ncbi:MAG: HAD family hydrolase [Candidatus Onthomonas sp.]
MNLKAVLFDIDNTLYSYDRAHAVAYARLLDYGASRLGLDQDAFQRLHKEAMAQVNAVLGIPCASMHNRLLRYQRMLELAGLPLHPHALEMESLYWDTLIDAAQPSPGALPCLEALKAAGYTIGVGTDMTLDYQLKKLTRMEMLPYIDFVVTSEEVLAEKPEAKLFLRCAEKAGAAPEQCLFIGDSLKKDVAGARAVGMDALWYQPDPELAARNPEVPSIQNFYQLRQRLCPAP